MQQAENYELNNDVNHGAEIRVDNYSEETSNRNYQPIAGTIYLNETE